MGDKTTSWMNMFFSKSKSDDDCKEIQRLSKEINDKITIINGFVKDNGFINEIWLELTKIRSKIRDFNITQTTVTKIVNELETTTPDCNKALADLKELQEVIDRKDSRIADLKRQLQDLSKRQIASVSQQELTEKQNNCKELCTTILTDINTQLAAIIPNFVQSGEKINKLLNDINAELSVQSRGSVEMKNMGRGNNGSVKTKDNVSSSNQSTNGRVVNSFSTSPSSNNSTTDKSTDKINMTINTVHDSESKLNRTDSIGSIRSVDSDDETPDDPLNQFPHSNGGKYFRKNKRGGYYYPTSSSGSKRNKKSTRNRKKNKKNKKTRR